jgi:Protein of unknown function, DUF481
MNIRLVAFQLLFLFALPLFARDKTDVIVMKNGDRITCEIRQLSTGVLSIKLSYAEGTIGVQWSEVARIESSQLFQVQTEAGAVYTGKLSTTSASGDRAIGIEVASTPEKAIDIPQVELVKLNTAGDSFWHRFNGAINTGVLYSKGNQSTQYNIGSQLEYRRERWSAEASVNSSLASSARDNASTRNQIDFNTKRLLPWNNWFYSGTGTFLQSSVQGIDLQTTLGGEIGRYLRNSNKASLYVLGGVAWQNAQYKTYTPNQGAQNTAAALVAAELQVFRFKKTNLDISAVILPEISEPGRVRTNTNASYYIKLFSDLSWNLSFYGSWDNQPPPTLSGSDYGTSSGISWTFGNR